MGFLRRWCVNIDWNEHFYLDESSASGLRWKVYRQGVKRSMIAGSLNNQNYWKVKVHGKSYQVHRVIWEMNFGDIPHDCFIDHIDRNPSNNNLSNLRMVSHKNNCENRDYVCGASGKIGVVWYTNKSGNKYAIASWRVDGKSVHKCFSVKRLGEVAAFVAASKFRDEKILELNTKGSLYSLDRLDNE